MKRTSLLNAIAALALSLSPLVAASTAAAADLYTVRGVHVDVTAASATEARTIAQGKGQQEALGELLRRLTLSSDWSRLPQPTDSVTQDAVRGFQVASEKASTTRYIADLNVAFRPAAIRNMLKANGIQFGETQARPALLVAVYDKGGKVQMWEDSNPWRAAVAKRDLENAMTPLLLPVGDVQEFGILSVTQAQGGDKNAIADLGRRYGADDVIVAQAVSTATGIALTVNRYGLGDTPVIKRTYPTLDDAAVGLMGVIGDQWKRDTIVAPGTQAHMTAMVNFTSMGQWEAIRKALAATPIVNGLQVQGITTQGAEVQISFRGTAEKLALSLAQANVSLTQDATGWLLKAR
tara:strand:- start:2304 stop:3353 length:1050 start_codon:yes stop_codon:yes gene_type:complete